MMNFKPHKYALLFPAMSEQEYAELKASIAKDGLIDEIVLLDGKILEGVHRFRACKELGIEARFVNWDDLPEAIKKIGPLAYACAKNVPRRHLTTEQRVKLALELLPRLKQEAQAREKAGKTLATNGARGKATEIAAGMVGGVSARTVERALRAEREERDGAPATEQPPESDLVGEVFTLLRKAKSTIKAFPGDVSVETVERLARAVDIVRSAIYKLREPAKGEPFTDDSICPFGKYKGQPMRKVPDRYLRWWLKQNPDRKAIDEATATFDHREKAIALRSLKVWDYITERFSH
jgi:hypothetical protein